MIGFYNYSVILTYAGLVSAIVGMASALGGGENGLLTGVLCLMVCGLCDMFDGTIASKCKRSDDAKCFGVQIDSLCDLVCFGVFPAVLVYSLNNEWYTIACMAAYVLAGVIRLAYFNVQEINRTSGERRAYYEGLPITSSALIFPIAISLCSIIGLKWTPVYSIVMLLTAVAFVTRFKVKKPHMTGLTILALIGLTLFVLIWFGDIIHV